MKLFRSISNTTLLFLILAFAWTTDLISLASKDSAIPVAEETEERIEEMLEEDYFESGLQVTFLCPDNEWIWDEGSLYFQTSDLPTGVAFSGHSFGWVIPLRI